MRGQRKRIRTLGGGILPGLACVGLARGCPPSARRAQGRLVGLLAGRPAPRATPSPRRGASASSSQSRFSGRPCAGWSAWPSSKRSRAAKWAWISFQFSARYISAAATARWKTFSAGSCQIAVARRRTGRGSPPTAGSAPRSARGRPSPSSPCRWRRGASSRRLSSARRKAAAGRRCPGPSRRTCPASGPRAPVRNPSASAANSLGMRDLPHSLVKEVTTQGKPQRHQEHHGRHADGILVAVQGEPPSPLRAAGKRGQAPLGKAPSGPFRQIAPVPSFGHGVMRCVGRISLRTKSNAPRTAGGKTNHCPSQILILTIFPLVRQGPSAESSEGGRRKGGRAKEGCPAG